jgi:Transposase DDE domain
MEVSAMKDSKVLQRFIETRPLCVMTRCILGHLMTEELEGVFAQCRHRQYEGDIKFSALALSVADVALSFCANFNQAYKKHKEELTASVVAYYRKLNRVEPSISEGVVQYAGRKTAELRRAIGAETLAVLPGYRCAVLDGNHLSKTEKRIHELRGLRAAALPGIVVAKFNLDDQSFDRAYLLEDAHAQESTVLDRVTADLQPNELLIADRHFCIVSFLWEVAAASACFVIRQHGRLHGELLGKRRKIGRSDTGIVYEQKLRIRDSNSERTLIVRRITVELDTPSRDGDREIHLLSNVPRKQVDARQLAQLYRDRWEIENAFYVLTMTLTCEVKSIGHPRAALFLFCMAMVAYNCRQLLYATLRTAHEASAVDAMSEHAVALEIVQPMDGLVTAIPECEWDEVVPSSVSGRAAFLRRVSRHVDVAAHRKTVRGPKKPRPPRQRCHRNAHVATYRLLQGRSQRC